MNYTWVAVTVANILFCLIIVILGYLGYAKNKSELPLYLAVAFALFCLSHILALLSQSSLLGNLIIIIRGLAYIIIILALGKFLAQPK